MSAYSTKIDIPAATRDKVIALLNSSWRHFRPVQPDQAAHWNVKGIHFIALHELFDKLAEEVEDYVDDIAERATALGGIAFGTARAAAKVSRLAEFPLEVCPARAAVEALVERFAVLASSTRKAIETSGSLGDADTSDLFTGVSRGLDKNLWFLEAHLQ